MRLYNETWNCRALQPVLIHQLECFFYGGFMFVAFSNTAPIL